MHRFELSNHLWRIIRVGIKVIVSIDWRMCIRHFAGDQVILHNNLLQINWANETKENITRSDIVANQIILAQLTLHHLNG